jgi:hypothetical protein
MDETKEIIENETKDDIAFNIENFNVMKDCVRFYSDEKNFSKQLNELNITLTAKKCLDDIVKKIA